MDSTNAASSLLDIVNLLGEASNSGQSQQRLVVPSASGFCSSTYAMSLAGALGAPGRISIVPASALPSSYHHLAVDKKRINRGRTYKAHKGVYNVVIEGTVIKADDSLDLMRRELQAHQAKLGPIIINQVDVCSKLGATVDLLPHLNNPSYCGAVVAGHLFPKDFFVNHILRDTEGNVKAAKGFINYSNREPVSREASQLFYDVLLFFGGVLIEKTMQDSWMWIARKGVNDRGNTSKSGRGVRYFVEDSYVPVLEYDYWGPSTATNTATMTTATSPLSTSEALATTSAAGDAGADVGMLMESLSHSSDMSVDGPSSARATSMSPRHEGRRLPA